MKRKVSLIGPSTLMVSLPSKWVKQFNVKKGDEIDIEEDDHKLVISLGHSSVSKKIKIDLIKHQNLIRKLLLNAYRAGFDEINITFGQLEDLKTIQHFISTVLLGFEIIEQGKNTCTLRNVTKESEEEFESMFRRTFQVTSIMLKNGLEALKHHDIELIKETTLMETTNNKFVLFCERLLNKKGVGNFLKTNFTFAAVYQLEKIADELKYIFDYISEHSIKISADVVKFYEKVNMSFDLCQSAFYDFTEEKAEEISSIKEKILLSSESLYNTANKNEACIIGRLINIMQFIHNILNCTVPMHLDKMPQESHC